MATTMRYGSGGRRKGRHLSNSSLQSSTSPCCKSKGSIARCWLLKSSTLHAAGPQTAALHTADHQ
eukprot:11258655-Alexandrium_andersonii.AAC.1